MYGLPWACCDWEGVDSAELNATLRVQALCSAQTTCMLAVCTRSTFVDTLTGTHPSYPNFKVTNNILLNIKAPVLRP